MNTHPAFGTIAVDPRLSALLHGAVLLRGGEDTPAVAAPAAVEELDGLRDRWEARRERRKERQKEPKQPRKRQEKPAKSRRAAAAVMDQLRKLGGKLLAKKLQQVRKQYGVDVETTYVRALSTHAGLAAAYTTRADLLANPDQKEMAKSITRQIHAVENQILNAVLECRPVPEGMRAGFRDMPVGSAGMVVRQYADGHFVIVDADKKELIGKALRSGDLWKRVTTKVGNYPTDGARSVRSMDTQSTASLIASGANRLADEVQNQTAKDALRVGGATAGGVAKGAAAYAVAGQLLTAAGVSASIPVAGWVVAAGAGIAAGSIALVGAIRAGRARKDEAKRLAKAAGIDPDDAEKVPDMVLDAFKWSAARREQEMDELRRLRERCDDGLLKWCPIGRDRDRISARLRILAVVHLIERAERVQKGLIDQKEAERAGREGCQFFSKAQKRTALTGEVETSLAEYGFGNVHLFDVRGFPTADLAGISASALEQRIQRGLAGDITAGGTVDPREAAAYVAGYLRKRYVPTQRAAGKMTAVQGETLTGIAGKFAAAAAAPDASTAIKMVLTIGAGSAPVDTLKGALGVVFDKYVSSEPARNWSLQVLRHGAALMAAANEPTASAKLALAISGDATRKAQIEGGILAGVQFGAAAIAREAAAKVALLKDTAAAAAQAGSDALIATAKKAEATTTKTISGALNVLGATANATKERAREATDTVTQAATDLAKSGAGTVKEKIDEAQAIGAALKTATAQEAAEAKEQLAAVGETIRTEVMELKASRDTAQAALAAKVEAGLREAGAATAQATKAAFAVPAALREATRAGITGALKGASSTVKEALQDPCALVPTDTAQRACRRAREAAQRATDDPCELLPFPLSITCRYPWLITVGPLIGVGLIAVLGVYGTRRLNAQLAEGLPFTAVTPSGADRVPPVWMDAEVDAEDADEGFS